MIRRLFPQIRFRQTQAGNKGPGPFQLRQLFQFRPRIGKRRNGKGPFGDRFRPGPRGLPRTGKGQRL